MKKSDEIHTFDIPEAEPIGYGGFAVVSVEAGLRMIVERASEQWQNEKPIHPETAFGELFDALDGLRRSAEFYFNEYTNLSPTVTVRSTFDTTETSIEVVITATLTENRSEPVAYSKAMRFPI